MQFQKKQSDFATSSAEAKYLSLEDSVQESGWIGWMFPFAAGSQPYPEILWLANIQKAIKKT